MADMPASLLEALRAAGARVEERFDGVRIELPPRPPMRPIGAALTAVGVAVTLFMFFWLSVPLSGLWRGHSPHPFQLIFALFGVPGLLAGLAMFFGGLALWSGRSRCAVEVSGRWLRLQEFFPPFRWSWKREISAIRRFTVGLTPEEIARGGAPDFVAEWARRGVRVEGTFPAPLMAALFYPAPVTRAVADALAEATNRARPERAAAPAAAVVDASAGLLGEEPETPRPPNTKVRLIEHGDGFAYDIPPVGVWRGSRGLFVFSLLWLGFCGFVILIPTFSGGQIAWPLLPFVALFVAIGAALLLFAVNAGRRRTMLAANAKTLGLREKGLFGMKEKRAPRAEISAIRAGPSGVEINDRPVLELQIHLRDGRKIGCLSQLTEDELRWLAQELRRRLGAPRTATPENAN